jgi:hypothetical protein
MVACSACHYEMPHQNGQTYPPPMEACFNCHGIEHGPQGQLARSDCAACHTKSFTLRPATHVQGYAGKLHADRAKQGVNGCLLCHKASKDCDACHVKENVRVNGKPIGPMPKTYTPIAPITASKPTVKIYPNGPTTMGQCIYCHPDIDAFNKSKVIFAHAEHLRRDYACTVCHPQFGHGTETINRPPMETCYQCHGLTHAAGGLVATMDCGKCHPKDFKLMPDNHTAAFIAGGHKKRASDDVSYCSMCHQPDFCVTCHQGRKKLADGTFSPRVIPADHRRADWSSTHGPLYIQQKGACGACHDSQSCTTCHYTSMPHPTDWLTTHGRTAHGIASAKRDCNVCHVNRERCQACHHDSSKGQTLTLDHCAAGPGLHGCHAEMAQVPAASIQNKAFAEHAVHFNVAKKKGKPYKCYECHIGFGTDSGTANLADAGHDLRLCYGCHGSLNAFGDQIAPYPGAELCRRCHSNLNI